MTDLFNLGSGGTSASSAQYNPQAVSQLGYNLGLGGGGISLPFGQAFNSLVTPQKVYAAESSGDYTGMGAGPTGYPIPSTFSSTPGTSPPAVNNPNPVQQQSTTSYQQQWEQAGHVGTAPVGYHGEGGGGGASQDPLISGANAYISQLNDMLSNGLPAEAAGQQKTAQGIYDYGMSTAGTNKTSSENTVNTSTAKNLKDLGSNIQNLFQSGNVYLGARGAGDSSAANQYAYALTNMGSKQRSAILSDATTRLGQIGDIFNNESARLKSELDTQMGGIASWLANAQNTIKSQIGSIGYQSAQQQSQQAYNLALNAVNNAQATLGSNRAALTQWAANNSTSLQGFIKNLQGVQQTPQWGSVAGMPTVSGGQYNLPAATGYGTTDTQKKDIFGNPVQ